MKPACGSMELGLGFVKISVTAFIEDDQHDNPTLKASIVACVKNQALKRERQDDAAGRRFINRKPGLRLESGPVCEMDELVCLFYLGSR